MKVAFSVDEVDALWDALDNQELHLPEGWSLDETDSSGARYVAVFRIEGVMPTFEDGLAVQAALDAIQRRSAPAP